MNADHGHLDSAAIVATLAELVRINSVNPNYEGGVPELQVADYIEAFFSQRGIQTWRQWVYPDRPNVIARIPGRDSGRRIVFEAHMDTVSVTDMAIPAWEPTVREGRLYGRGACDNKGGLAAMMHALAGLAAMKVQPAVDVIFAATIDEEYSYRGVVALCASLEAGVVPSEVLTQPFPPEKPICAEAAIVAEPTQLQAVIASKGVVRWKIETMGRAAHSSKPHLGVNAIAQMAQVISAIEADNQRLAAVAHPLLGPATCNIGVIRGGVQVNFVPERCEIELDRRMLPGETLEQVMQHYQQLTEDLTAASPALQISMHPPMLSDRPLETAADSPAAQSMVRLLRSMGLDDQLVGVPFGSDASKFGAIGIPSLILGPGSIDQAHAAIEFVELNQVIQATEIYQRYMLESFP